MILSGGSGTRLWPLSRSLRPKQLLALNGEQTLLQQTAKRLTRHINPSHLYTVTHEDHKFQVKGQLAELYPEAIANVLAEPSSKNTLPSIAWATYKIFKQDASALIGVFASDHRIDNEEAFLSAWQTAETVAEQDYLALLGIKPHELATGYGYIKPNLQLSFETALAVHQVEHFVEKPDAEKARQFVRDGYLWNSGMFVFKASTFMQLLQRYQPQIYEQVLQLNQENLVKSYAQFPNLSMDYGLVEVLVKQAEKIAVVPVDMAWSDLGSWDSIYTRHEKDANNNVTYGEVVSMDTENSLIWTETGLVAILGIDNVFIIQTADATLICDRSRSEDIKSLVAKVKIRKPELTEIHQTVYRHWGSYTVLEARENFKIKRILVNPGAKLSLQMHKHRSEHWVVVSGTATIKNNETEYILEENQSTYIPQANLHRLENNTSEPLTIIEVQCGEYVGEDDILRFDDKSGRQLSNE